jgi:hypothetical protein
MTDSFSGDQLPGLKTLFKAFDRCGKSSWDVNSSYTCTCCGTAGAILTTVLSQ